MTINVTPAFVGLMITLVVYLIGTVWWAASLTSKVQSFGDKLDGLNQRIEEKLSLLKETVLDHEKQIRALWGKHDAIAHQYNIFKKDSSSHDE